MLSRTVADTVPTAISSLAETIQPILDLAARQHPDLCQGDMYNALQSQLRPKDQLTDEIAKLTVEDSNVKQEDVEKTMKEAIAALDKWRRTKSMHY